MVETAIIPNINHHDVENDYLFWNPIGGHCSHSCRYCFPGGTGKLFLDKEFIDFNQYRANFVGICISYSDMWSKEIPIIWIKKILKHCHTYDATYTFCTKNPARYHQFIKQLPSKVILSTTLETNRDYKISSAPCPEERFKAMCSLPKSIPRSVRISPVFDFDLDVMLSWIREIEPFDVRLQWLRGYFDIPLPSREKSKEFMKGLTEIAGFVVFEPKNIVIGGIDKRTHWPNRKILDSIAKNGPELWRKRTFLTGRRDI